MTKKTTAKVSEVEQVLTRAGYTRVGPMTWEDAKFVAAIKTDPEGVVTCLSMFHKRLGMSGDVDLIHDEKLGWSFEEIASREPT